MNDKWELFAEGYLNRHTGGKKSGLDNAIKGEKHDYILNVDKSDYLSHLVEQYTITPVEIDFDGVYLETDKVRGKTQYQLHFPIAGNLELLKFQPPDFNGWTTTGHLVEGESEFWVRLELENGNPEAEDVQSTVDKYTEKIGENYNFVISDIKEFNEDLSSYAEKKFDETKRRYLKDMDIEEKLDVPVKARSEQSKTFAIEPPEKREEIKVEKPELPDTSPLKVVPSLSKSTYSKILTAINDIGKGFERSPRLFIDREEEDLRDYFLFFLEMNFEGSATGETFNNEGKTDILLRHEGENVFISECAWWNGKKRFSDKISQLNKYLTWRDTKTAVVLFSNNKSPSKVHEQIIEGTKEHPQFKEFVERKDHSWFQYEFYFPEDENRTIDLAVIIFHLRQSEEKAA